MENNDPKVYYTPQELNTPKREWFKPKYLFYVLAAVVLLELVWGAKTLLAPVPSKKTPQPAATKQASLILSSGQKDLKVGDSLLVNVNLSTGGHRTVGADLVLKYDSNVLSASPSAFTRGTVYPDCPAVSIDDTKGIILVSGVAEASGNGFDGIGIFGMVAFKAKAPGRAIIWPDFTKGETTDSNIFETGTAEDILEDVNNLEVNVR